MSPACSALNLALVKTGKSIAARIAIMAITTSNSIRVKPTFRARVLHLAAGAGSGCMRILKLSKSGPGFMCINAEQCNPYVAKRQSHKVTTISESLILPAAHIFSNRFGAGLNVQFFINATEIASNGGNRDPQFVGHLFIRKAIGQAIENHLFAG
jgi:hypothetical protein